MMLLFLFFSILTILPVVHSESGCGRQCATTSQPALQEYHVSSSDTRTVFLEYGCGDAHPPAEDVTADFREQIKRVEEKIGALQEKMQELLMNTDQPVASGSRGLSLEEKLLSIEQRVDTVLQLLQQAV